MEEVVEKSLDSELWHACAGAMVQMPMVNSRVFYFPQGHAEHTLSSVDFGALPRIPPMILCRVDSVKYLADPETDEVYSKIRLIPFGSNDHGIDDDGDDDDGFERNRSESNEIPTSFAKTLTQSDANNGGGFSVPRHLAETIFPPLDYNADPPVQTLIAKSIHGETWKFRHIYRGKPRRHLLTTGWSNYVNQKKLVAGDSIVFFRAKNGDLCIGIRRAKRGFATNVASFGGHSALWKEDENKMMYGSVGNGNLREKGRVRPEEVVEAALLAVNGQPFEVVYYPRASTPDFCVKASSVSAAMRMQWCYGMRLKMAFETEDPSRISWFMGTIAAVQVEDPFRWPNSPWRLLQVTWDEPDQLQNVKCVNPWVVEMVSNIPVLHLPPPNKKLCLSLHPNLSLDDHFRMPSFSGNPLGPTSNPLSCLPDNITAGIQGARHAQIGVPFSDLHLSNKFQTGLLPSHFMHIDTRPKILDGTVKSQIDGNENTSCLLTNIGNYSQKLKSDSVKTTRIVLFGQPILIEQQMSCDNSCDEVSEITLGNRSGNSARDPQNVPKNLSTVRFLGEEGFHVNELGLGNGHCKVFLEAEDIGQTLDLSVIRSYEELYRRLEIMFGIERSEMWNNLFYCDATGAAKQAGEEPFSEFIKSAKRLTIRAKPSSNSAERGLIAGLPTAERGLDPSNQAGPLSTFA